MRKKVLKLNVGVKYKGLYAKLYYYNKKGKLEYVQSDKVEADGTVIFTFKHASDYAIILSKHDASRRQSDYICSTQKIEQIK